jgi:methionyl aminopeptidase
MKTRNVKLGRNDPCPCGSGLKFKKCCLGKSVMPNRDIEDLYNRKYGIRLKKEPDIEGIRRAGRLVLETLDLVESIIKPGLVTEEIKLSRFSEKCLCFRQ